MASPLSWGTSLEQKGVVPLSRRTSPPPVLQHESPTSRQADRRLSGVQLNWYHIPIQEKRMSHSLLNKKRDFKLMETTTQEKNNLRPPEIPAKKVKMPLMTTKKKEASSSSSKNKNKNWSCIPRNLDVGRRQRARFLETLKEMGIHDPIFLLEKNITDSDTNRQQNRLLIPCDAFDLESSPFFKLADDNKRETLKEGKALNIRVMDESKREYSLTLKYLESNKAFRIIGADWNRFVNANALRKGQNLELWGFQREMDGVLYFAMINYDFPTQEVIEAARILLSLKRSGGA